MDEKTAKALEDLTQAITNLLAAGYDRDEIIDTVAAMLGFTAH